MKERWVEIVWNGLKNLNGRRGRWLNVRKGLEKMDVGELQELNQLILSIQGEVSSSNKRAGYRAIIQGRL